MHTAFFLSAYTQHMKKLFHALLTFFSLRQMTLMFFSSRPAAFINYKLRKRKKINSPKFQVNLYVYCNP